MTIAAVVNKVSIQTDGVTSIFSWSFFIPSASDLQVYQTDPSGNVTLLNPASYTVLPNSWDADGGSLQYLPGGNPQVAGYTITIYRVVPLQQLVHLGSSGNYNPDIVENGLDYLMMAIQQINEASTRVVTAPVGDPIGQLTLPAAASRANKVFGFDSNGNPSMVSNVPLATQPGDIAPSVDNTYNLGSTILRWANAFISGAAKFFNSGFAGSLTAGTLTANRTYTLPDSSGAIALVPLTDAAPQLFKNGSPAITSKLSLANLTAARILTLPDANLDLGAPNFPSNVSSVGSISAQGGITIGNGSPIYKESWGYQAGNQGATNNTTLQNSSLALGVNNGERWLVRFVCFFSGVLNGASGLSIAVTGPAASALQAFARVASDKGSAHGGQFNTTFAQRLDWALADFAANSLWAEVVIDLVVTASANGVMVLQFAQQTSSPSTLNILQGSYVSGRRIL